MISIYKIIFTSICLCLFSYLHASIAYTKTDSLIYENYVEQFSQVRSKPIGDLIVLTAKYFIDKPYVAYTLDNQTNKEVLTINLREFDCTTFVETCIALSQTLKSDDPSFSNFCLQLQCLRYRDGIIEDYSSRLHYVSDWIHDNTKTGYMNDITKKLGGTHRNKNINFMSTHPDLYIRFKNNAELQTKIQNMERSLNKMGGDYVIDKKQIPNKSPDLMNGDIVVFSTTISGIDFSHIGIVYKKNGRLTFIHASSRAKKVIIENNSLYEYCQNSKTCDGVVFVRLNDI